MLRTATRRVVVAMLVSVVLLGSAPAGAADRPAPATSARAAHGSVGRAVAILAVPRQEDLTEGLRVASRQVVEVDLEGAVLRVRHEVELRNETPNRVSGPYVQRRYWSHFAIPVFTGATGVAATRSDGRSLPVRVTPADQGVLAIAEIDLQPDLFFGETQSIVLTYEMTTQPPRSGTLAQVNRAIATFPLVGLGDPGLTEVEVRLPTGHQLDVIGAEMSETVEGDQVVLRATELADPATWVTSVLVRNDAALQTREVSYGPHTVVLQGWPGDDEWLTSTADLAERGLPALEGVIGWGWDEPRTIDVVETVSPYLYGFAGWYRGSGDTAVIEIGDALEPQVTLHEMAHAWFNATTFSSRWASEAFADETAALAMVELGLERPDPEPASPDQPGALPLESWADPDLQDPEAEDQERYGYNTSWWIARQLTDEIGADGLRAVLVAAHDGRSAYDHPAADDAPPDGAATDDHAAADDPAAADATAADRLDIGVVDWRELLDLLEDVGGSRAAADLWRTFVVDPGQLELLGARDRARADYDRLLDEGDGWLPPRALRDEMARWDFGDAAAMVDDVDDLLERRDVLVDAFVAAGIGLPSPLQAEFEAALDLDDLDSRLDEVDEALDAVTAAEDSVDGVDLLQRIGLLFEDPADHVEEAVASLEAGAYDEAVQRAHEARRQVDDATRDGVVRATGAVGLVLLAGIGVRQVVRRRSSMRRRRDAAS